MNTIHSPNFFTELSRSSSFDLLLKYGPRPDVRILINPKNLRISESRNRGLRESPVEWAQFLDDDVKPDAALYNAERCIRQHPNASGFIRTTLVPRADTVATAAIHLAGVGYFWDIARKMQDHTDLPWGRDSEPYRAT
ncbi:hypothetical protein FRB98_005233 [Tulasnella sp. 332]|nr:hypothetical protein FRB98_005233 [Tulasnella sp. 332]